MSFPYFLIPYIIGASPVGMAVFVAKAAVYCLFQRPLGTMKMFVLAIVLHLLSSAVGIGAGLLILPGQGFGWKTFLAVYYLYAASWSMGCEFLCLFLLRKKLALQRVGASAVAANTTYYLILAIGGAVFAGLGLLTYVE